MVIKSKKSSSAKESSKKPAKKKSSGAFTVQKDREFTRLIDKQWYKAKFTEHEVRSGNYGDYVILKFEVIAGFDEEGGSAKGRKNNGIVDGIVSPKSKLYKFIKACNGNKELDIDDEVDITAYYGKIVKAFNENKKNKGTGDIRSNFSDFRVYEKKG